ncbi:hypothetical protein HCH_05022 [Hahella chejuensis KCTC 2396]|uniref:Uncharacterized protein n=1 Tax=Hahella chejuensis (strain KCTC 2396) TaxID=349521 RepID=Q2SCB7_HAHCH|nr:hypothetical protein [Hahella chejuensis]ABC31707.1 hypothetical protein HCH_05022 [Hahella chejuensis KCTC 2396]
MKKSATNNVFSSYELEVRKKLKGSDTPYLGLIDGLISQNTQKFVENALVKAGGNLKNFEKGLNIAPALFVSYLSHSLRNHLGADTSAIWGCINLAMGRKAEASQTNEERRCLWLAFRKACKKLELPVSNRLFGPRYMVDAYLEQAGVPEASLPDLMGQLERYARRYGLPEQDDITAQLTWYESFKKALKSSFGKQNVRALLNDSQGYYLRRYLDEAYTSEETSEDTLSVAIFPQLMLDGDEIYIKLPKLEDGVAWEIEMDGNREVILVKDKEQRYYLESLATKNIKVTYESGPPFEFQLWHSDRDNQFAIFDADTGALVGSHCLSEDGAVFSPGQYIMLSRFDINDTWITLDQTYQQGFFLGFFELVSGDNRGIKRGPVTFLIHTHDEASILFEGDIVVPHSGKSFYCSDGLCVNIKIPGEWEPRVSSYELELYTSDGEASHRHTLSIENCSASVNLDYCSLDWCAGFKRVIAVVRRHGEKRVLARQSALVWCGLKQYNSGFRLDIKELPTDNSIDVDSSNNIRIDTDSKSLVVIDPDLPFVEVCFNITNRQKTTIKFALPGTFIYISDLKDGFRQEQLLPLGSTLSCSYDDTRRIRIFSTDECQVKLGSHILHHRFDKKRWFKTSLTALLDKVDRDQNALTLWCSGYPTLLLKIVSPLYVEDWNIKSSTRNLEISFCTPAGFSQVDIHATNLMSRSEQFVSLNVHDTSTSQYGQFGGMLIHQDADTKNQMISLDIENVPDGLWLLEFSGSIEGKWGRFTNQRHDHLGAGVIIERGHIVPFTNNYFTSLQTQSSNDKQQLFELTNRILKKCFELNSWQSMHWIKDIWAFLLNDPDIINPDQLSRVLSISHYRAREEDSPSWVPQVHIGGFNPDIYCGPSKSYKRIDAQNSVRLKSMKVIGEAGNSLVNTLRTELLDVALVAAFENRGAIVTERASPRNLSIQIVQAMLPSLFSESQFKSLVAGDLIPALGDMLGGRHLAYCQYEFLMKSRSSQVGNEFNRPTLNSLLFRFIREHENNVPVLIPEDYFEYENERNLLIAACSFSSLFAKQCRSVFWESRSLNEFCAELTQYLVDGAKLENILSYYLGVSGNLFHYFLLLWDVYFISRQQASVTMEGI